MKDFFITILFLVLIINTLVLLIAFIISKKYNGLERKNDTFYRMVSTYVGREKRECTFGKYRFCNLDRRMLCRDCYLDRKVGVNLKEYKFIQKIYRGSLFLEIVLLLTFL